MKRLFHTIVLCCLFAPMLGSCSEAVQLSPEETTEVRNKLDGYNKGTLTLEEVGEGEAWVKKVILYHLTHSNEVTVKMKLPIARCYAMGGIYSNAVELATEYLNVYTNDGRAWDMLSGAQAGSGSFEKALAAGTNALRFGCERSIESTGFLALKVDRLDVFESMLAHRLLVLKDAAEIPVDKRRQMINMLIIYSLQADRKEVFLKALEDLDTAMARADSNLVTNIGLGLDHFGLKDTEKFHKFIAPAENGVSATGK